SGVTTVVTAVPDWLARPPMVHVAAGPPMQLPCVVFAETKVTPGGSASVTETPVAGFVPKFAAIKVYVRVPPTTALLGDTEPINPTSSVAVTLTVVEAVLFAGGGLDLLAAPTKGTTEGAGGGAGGGARAGCVGPCVGEA